jgi:hypothetical protein
MFGEIICHELIGLRWLMNDRFDHVESPSIIRLDLQKKCQSNFSLVLVAAEKKNSKCVVDKLAN